MMIRSANVGEVGVMRHQDDGQSLAAVELLKRGHDFGRGLRVEIPGRLVGEQNRGPVDERARDCDPLLLTAGELIGMIALASLEPKEQEHLVRALRRP